MNTEKYSFDHVAFMKNHSLTKGKKCPIIACGRQSRTAICPQCQEKFGRQALAKAKAWELSYRLHESQTRMKFSYFWQILTDAKTKVRSAAPIDQQKLVKIRQNMQKDWGISPAIATDIFELIIIY